MFTLSRVEYVAAVVRRMLKTPVTLRNICRVLLNLIKRLIMRTICNVQRLPSPPNVHALNIHISSLFHQLRLPLALTFVFLPYMCF